MKAIEVKDKKQTNLIIGLAVLIVIGIVLAVVFSTRGNSGEAPSDKYVTVTDENGNPATDANGNVITKEREEPLTDSEGNPVPTAPNGNIIPTREDGSLWPTTPDGYILPTLPNGEFVPTKENGGIDPQYTTSPISDGPDTTKVYPDVINLGGPFGTVRRVSGNVFEGTFDPASMPDLITDVTYENNRVTFTKGFYLKDWYGDYQVKQLIYYRYMDSVDEDGTPDGGYMPQANFTPSETDAVVFLHPESISSGRVDLIDNDLFLHFQIEFVS